MLETHKNVDVPAHHSLAPQRFLFCTLAGAGYVLPAIEIAKVLLERGHQVAFVTGDRFASEIEACGAMYLEPPEGTFKHFHIPYWGLVSGVEQQARYTEEAIRDWKPDCVLSSSLALGPMIAARKAELPVAVLGLGTYTWPVEGPIGECSASSEYTALASRRLKECEEIYEKVCALLGAEAPECKGVKDHRLPLLGDTFLLQSVPSLENRPLPQNVSLIGSCFPESRPLDIQSKDILREIAGREYLYVQHDARWVNSFLQNGKTQEGVPDFLPLMAEIAESKLIVVSSNDPELRNTAKHPNIIVGHHLDHSVFIPRAQLIIGVGTSSLMLSAMRKAKPLFIITTASESFDVADVCERSGTGLVCPADEISEQRLRDGIREILSKKPPKNSREKRLERVQKEFADRDSSALAADALEALIDR